MKQGDHVRILPAHWAKTFVGRVGTVKTISTSQDDKPTAWVGFHDYPGGTFVHTEELELITEGK